MLSFVSIAEQCEKFQKIAGLIKVPPQLLHQVQEWAFSTYCKEMSKYLYEAFVALKSREPGGNLMRAVHQKAAKLEQQHKLLESFVQKKITFTKLTNNSLKFALSIPSFHFNRNQNDMSDRDPKTGLNGIIFDEPLVYLSLDIDKNSENIRAMLSIKEQETENNLFSEKQLRKYLFDLMPWLNENIGIFTNFIYNTEYFQSASQEQIRSMQEVLYFCRGKIKKIESIKTFTFSIDSLKLNIKSQLLGLNDIEFECAFAFDWNSANKIHANEPWVGLWENSSRLYHAIHIDKETGEPSQRNTLRLGRLFMHRNILADRHTILYLEADQKLKFLQDSLDQIATTVRHELEHLMQTLISRLTVSLAGLPSDKITEDKYTYRGHLLDPSNTDRTHPTAPRLSHPLQDVEFYTNLADDIQSFKNLVVKLPIYIQKPFFRAWIGEASLNKDGVFAYIKNKEGKIPNPAQWQSIVFALDTLNNNETLFKKLRKYQPLKWQKAVKEFSKATGF